jgi:hypothetical protein
MGAGVSGALDGKASRADLEVSGADPEVSGTDPDGKVSGAGVPLTLPLNSSGGYNAM